MNMMNTVKRSSTEVNNNSGLNLIKMNARAETIEEDKAGTIRILKNPNPRLFWVTLHKW